MGRRVLLDIVSLVIHEHPLDFEILMGSLNIGRIVQFLVRKTFEAFSECITFGLSETKLAFYGGQLLRSLVRLGTKAGVYGDKITPGLFQVPDTILIVRSLTPTALGDSIEKVRVELVI